MPPKKQTKKESNIQTKVRSICWTLNNYTPESTQELDQWDQVTYCVYGQEVSETGTPHLQGYTEFKTAVRFCTVKDYLPTAHIEPRYRKSTAKQASDYCKKGEQSHAEWSEFNISGPNYGRNAVIVEYGKISLPQGYRSDVLTATNMIDSGYSMRDVALANPEAYVRYHKGFQAYKAITIPKRTGDVHVRVFYGPTGCGKTHVAFEEFKGTNYYVWDPTQGLWFDEYEGETNVIFDEFRGQFPLCQMLALLQSRECRVQYKGGTVQFNGLNIILTSPTHPINWYQSCGDDKVDQLMRRIHEIRKFEVKYEPPVLLDESPVSTIELLDNIDDLS